MNLFFFVQESLGKPSEKGVTSLFKEARFFKVNRVA